MIWPFETTVVGNTNYDWFDALSMAIDNEQQYGASNLYIDIKDARELGILPIPR